MEKLSPVRTFFLVLTLMVLVGCEEFPMNLYGQLEVVSPDEDFIMILDDKSEIKKVKSGPISMKINSASEIQFKDKDSKDFWNMRLGLIDLSKIVQNNDHTFYSKELTQRFDLKVSKKRKFISSEVKTKEIQCFFRKRTKRRKNGVSREIASLRKGRQLAKIEIKKYHDIFHLNFLRRYDKITLGKFTAEPMVYEVEDVVEELEDCQ